MLRHALPSTMPAEQRIERLEAAKRGATRARQALAAIAQTNPIDIDALRDARRRLIIAMQHVRAWESAQLSESVA